MGGIEEVAPAPPHAADAPGVRTFRFSTDVYPERERIAAWREVFGRTVLHLDFIPHSSERFRANARIYRSSALRILEASTTASDQGASRSLIVNDDVSFVWVMSARSESSQLGRSGGLAAGDAVLFSHEDPGSLTFQGESRYMVAALPRATLARLVPDVGALFGRPVPASNPAQRMLRRHLEHAHEDLIAGGPDLRAAFIDHVADLLALALGAAGDVAALARTRGLAAARLRAMKDEIRKTCHHPDLSVGIVAARHAVSPRYVQRIFEQSGCTFTQFLNGQRLAAAYKALRRPGATPITTIAYDCGFSDISHFNRLFRQRYGCTPGDVRKVPRSEG